jgi:hypothetical protein
MGELHRSTLEPLTKAVARGIPLVKGSKPTGQIFHLISAQGLAHGEIQKRAILLPK